MKAKNNFKRVHTKTPGAAEAASPRSHPVPSISQTGGSKESMVRRRDIIRKQLLSSRKEKDV